MKRSFAEIKMNLLFHSLVFTSHLDRVLYTPLQKRLNNESHGGSQGRRQVAANTPVTLTLPWSPHHLQPLLSQHIPCRVPEQSQSRAGGVGPIAPGSQALLTSEAQSSHSPPLELPHHRNWCVLEKVMSSGAGGGTFFFILD